MIHKRIKTQTLFIGLAILTGLLAACTTTTVTQEPPTPAAIPEELPTPTPEVFIPSTAAVPQAPVISGSVVWGAEPVAGALVELCTGAWADPNNRETIARAVTNQDGQFEMEAPPNGGDYGLVAQWTDGGANTAPVTPVNVAARENLANVVVYLAKEIEWIEPISGEMVSSTPRLRWAGLSGISEYRLWIIDAGTTELVFELTMNENTGEEQSVILPPLTPGRTFTYDVQGSDPEGNLLARRIGLFNVAEPTPEAASSVADKCLTQGDNYYVDPLNAFCFAYPEGFEAQLNESGSPAVYGPALDDTIEPLRANLLVIVENGVEGKTLAEIVGAYLEEFSGMSVPEILRTDTKLDGEPAVMLEVVPGREGSRDLFMLENKTLYHLMFMPSVNDFPQAKDDVELLYSIVVDSFSVM